MDIFDIDDHIRKCRFCFRTFINEHDSVLITEFIKQKFFELTHIKIINTEIFSTHICQPCNDHLEEFYKFKNDLVQKQKRLYRTLKDHEDFMQKCENENFSCHDSALAIQEDDFSDTKYKVGVNCPDEMEEFVMVDDNTETNALAPAQQEISFNRIEENFMCDKCGFTNNIKSELKHHIKLHLKINQSDFWSCELCGQNFQKLHLLNRHVKIKHTKKERKYLCSDPKCKKAFYTISALKKHFESHSEKDMVCEHCGKLFSCINNLRSHLYYHAEPRFICDVEGCGKKFFVRKLLIAHLNMHRGQKDFCCDYCDKSYFFQAHLKRHVLSMHMRIKINCELCNSSFVRKETYKKHVINCHQSISSEELEKLLFNIKTTKVENSQTI